MLESQLPLSLNVRDDNTFDSFYPGDNASLIKTLKQTLISPMDGFIYLWGSSGVGCSHCLQAACHFAQTLRYSSFYLPLQPHLDPVILKDLERTDVVCLDDLEKIAGVPHWEEALFYLYNRIKTAQKKLIVAAQLPPKGIPIQLADLASRLQWGIVYHVEPLKDEDLVSALVLRAQKRGMILTDEVGEFIIKRVTRSMASLIFILEKLDKASLSLKRNITIPLVKKILAL